MSRREYPRFRLNTRSTLERDQGVRGLSEDEPGAERRRREEGLKNMAVRSQSCILLRAIGRDALAQPSLLDSNPSTRWYEKPAGSNYKGKLGDFQEFPVNAGRCCQIKTHVRMAWILQEGRLV
jgi:hypothetical protein